MKVLARGLYDGNEKDVEVLNPGEWFGKTHLLVIDPQCYADPILFCVEADHLSDAIEIFCESEQGKAHCGIDIEVAGCDYGFENEDGTKTDLKGNVIAKDNPLHKYISEPEIVDGGTFADIDNIHHSCIENWDCKYFFPEGVDPTELF